VAVRVVCLFHGDNRLIPWFPFIFQRFKRFFGGVFSLLFTGFLGFWTILFCSCRFWTCFPRLAYLWSLVAWTVLCCLPLY
jgi:hypothetical protein